MPAPKLPRSIRLISLIILLLSGLSQTAAAQSGVVPVPGTGTWSDTHIDVVAGELLKITAAGFWTEGETVSGPNGTDKPWPDNFFNFADLGACNYCAQTVTPHWGALIGYIGSAPPAPGSYTFPAVFPEVTKIFLIGEDYAASAPASGRLWLNKNTDAYSNYTVDNSGQIEAAVAVFPPETAEQSLVRAQAAAVTDFDPLTPLQAAADYCTRATFDHWQQQALKLMLKLEVCGPQAVDPLLWNICSTRTDLLWFAGMATKDILKIQADLTDGRSVDTTWDAGRLVYRVISMHPGAEGQLFGWFGMPAFYCTMAGLRFTGEIGGQLGSLIREQLRPPATLEADIAGDWTLTRSAPLDCINFTKGCQSTPLPLRIGPCSATDCAIARPDGVWQRSHTLTRQGDAWVGDFTDIAVSCTDDNNVDHENIARVGIRVTVTAADGGQAHAVGGFYTAQAATNPPCTGNARARWLLYGSR